MTDENTSIPYDSQRAIQEMGLESDEMLSSQSQSKPSPHWLSQLIGFLSHYTAPFSQPAGNALNVINWFYRPLFVIFAPILIQVLSLRDNGFSLMFAEKFKFEDGRVTLILVAFALSLITVGGFLQVIEHLASYYLPQRQYETFLISGFLMLALGLASAIPVAVMVRLLSSWTEADFAVFGVYLGLFTWFWLCSAMASAISKGWQIIFWTGLFFAGNTLTVLLEKSFHLVWAQLAALLLTGCAFLVFAILIQQVEDYRINLRKPIIGPKEIRRSFRQMGWPFVMGLAYFAFLFIDRALTYKCPSLTCRVNPGYEFSWILSLIPFFVTLFLIEFIGNNWRAWLQKKARLSDVLEHHKFNTMIRRYYLGALGVIVLLFIVTAAIVPLIKRPNELFDLINRPLYDPLAYLMTAIGNGFLTLGLFNWVILSQTPKAKAITLIVAIMINAALGLAAVQSGQPAIMGYIGGAVFIAGVSFWKSRAIFLDDYWYYRME